MTDEISPRDQDLANGADLSIIGATETRCEEPDWGHPDRPAERLVV